jgi:hypothetical protein
LPDFNSPYVGLGHGGDVRCKTALPPKAEVHRRPCYVAKVPISDLSKCSKLSKLLDHLVGAGEQGRRHVETERFRGLEVNNQLKLGRLLDR